MDNWPTLSPCHVHMVYEWPPDGESSYYYPLGDNIYITANYYFYYGLRTM